MFPPDDYTYYDSGENSFDNPSKISSALLIYMKSILYTAVGVHFYDGKLDTIKKEYFDECIRESMNFLQTSKIIETYEIYSIYTETAYRLTIEVKMKISNSNDPVSLKYVVVDTKAKEEFNKDY